MKRMTIKRAIVSKGDKPHCFPESVSNPSIDFRAYTENYQECYSQEQIDFLFKKGLLRKYEKKGYKWENKRKEYWEFTEKGKRWRIWYTTPFWLYIRCDVLHAWWFKNLWQRMMVKLFHKHYPYQEYIGVEPRDI